MKMQWPSPKAGEMWLAHFPRFDKPGVPNPDPHPVFVLGVEGGYALVACCTSQKFDRELPCQVKVDAVSDMSALGLTVPTTVQFSSLAYMPIGDAGWWKEARSGSPRLGALKPNSTLSRAFADAVKEAGRAHVRPQNLKPTNH